MAPRVTIVDVAREAGVAISTVSAALNGRPGVADETRGRIRAVADRLGWVPSIRGRSLSAKRTFSIGLVIQRDPRVVEADPFFWGFIGGVEAVLDEHGYALVLHTATSTERSLGLVRDMALARGVDGLLLTDVRTADPRFDLVRLLGLPAVAVNAPPGQCPVPTVHQAPDDALAQLMALLLRLGHRRIAHLAGSEGYVHSVQRERAWRQAMRTAGLADDLFVRGDFTSDSGMSAAARLLGADDPPTAIVCANDLSALGLIAGLRALGARVPQDVSVTGFDGIPLGQYTSPTLTTIQTSPHDLGRQGAGLLLAAIEGAQRSDATVAPAALLVRESVAPAPH